jgi:hypothetical protein
MNYETSSENCDLFFIELDGRHGNAIKPLSPADRARLEKIREKYIKAGLIPQSTPKTTEAEGAPQETDR